MATFESEQCTAFHVQQMTIMSTQTKYFWSTCGCSWHRGHISPSDKACVSMERSNVRAAQVLPFYQVNCLTPAFLFNYFSSHLWLTLLVSYQWYQTLTLCFGDKKVSFGNMQIVFVCDLEWLYFHPWWPRLGITFFSKCRFLRLRSSLMKIHVYYEGLYFLQLLTVVY